MDSKVIIELIGYIGSGLVVISMLMSSVVKLRIINSIGSSIFTVYALIIHSYPTAIMNFILVIINVYNLIKILKVTKNYNIVDGSQNESLLTYFLDYYKSDIKNYFPEFDLSQLKNVVVYFVCYETSPVGVLIADKKDTTLDIALDYTTPAYRDCSVGKYLYNELGNKGINQLEYHGNCSSHIAYLLKMGFKQSNSAYIKNLHK